ncbi:hypothetical protein LCGC14_0533320 [marine sediment metagenome]|uniref:ADP-ribosylglycohydrolase n=1 Tax=marine sediment metagenome TaxID=412755 RepID=A0A0F9SDB7_9ZZZZ
MLNPNPDILLYTAIGDAYCAACEYIKIKNPQDKKTQDKALKFEQYLSHPRHSNFPGTYTDDCAMSIGNTEVLLSDSWGKLDFANAWVDVFNRDPRDAYARSFQKFLEEVESGFEFLETIHPDSNKNGAAMRSSVFGVMPNPFNVLKVTTLQAKITHNTPGGLFGAQAVALMSHYAMYWHGPMTRGGLGSFLRTMLNPILKVDTSLANVFLEPWAGRIAGEELGIITALATFELLISCDSLLQILQKTIEWGGDTDSVAAIALGIASCRMPDDLPAFMHNQLEIGSNYGSVFLKDIGHKLMVKFSQ